MRALSLDLLRGSIDQVEQKVHMTWVQPRVLDKQQVSHYVQPLAVTRTTCQASDYYRIF